jgi:hypothetical protein
MGEHPDTAPRQPAPLGFQGVKFTREPDMVATYSVFVSSAGEMAPIRQWIEALVANSINPPLRDNVRAQLLPQMWERAQAQQQQPGRDANEIFVERALDSHATMALFRRQLRTGTEEEITALITRSSDERSPLSVLRFACDSGQAREADLDAFFELLNEEEVQWEDTGVFDSPEAWQTLVKVLVAYALAAFDDARKRERGDVY